MDSLIRPGPKQTPKIRGPFPSPYALALRLPRHHPHLHLLPATIQQLGVSEPVKERTATSAGDAELVEPDELHVDAGEISDVEDEALVAQALCGFRIPHLGVFEDVVMEVLDALEQEGREFARGAVAASFGPAALADGGDSRVGADGGGGAAEAAVLVSRVEGSVEGDEVDGDGACVDEAAVHGVDGSLGGDQALEHFDGALDSSMRVHGICDGGGVETEEVAVFGTCGALEDLVEETWFQKILSMCLRDSSCDSSGCACVDQQPCVAWGESNGLDIAPIHMLAFQDAGVPETIMCQAGVRWSLDAEQWHGGEQGIRRVRTRVEHVCILPDMVKLKLCDAHFWKDRNECGCALYQKKVKLGKQEILADEIMKEIEIEEQDQML